MYTCPYIYYIYINIFIYIYLRGPHGLRTEGWTGPASGAEQRKVSAKDLTMSEVSRRFVFLFVHVRTWWCRSGPNLLMGSCRAAWQASADAEAGRKVQSCSGDCGYKKYILFFVDPQVIFFVSCATHNIGAVTLPLLPARFWACPPRWQMPWKANLGWLNDGLACFTCRAKFDMRTPEKKKQLILSSTLRM